MKEKIIKIISDALTELNEELDYDSLKNITDATEIFGGDDGLDSLSLVRLVTEVEMNVNDEFDSSVLLASEKAMSMRNSPYRNVGSLTEFVISELESNR
ncbi:MAG: hypothetical protein AB8B92_07420 [Gammaproteobacteria bacterium]